MAEVPLVPRWLVSRKVSWEFASSFSSRSMIQFSSSEAVEVRGLRLVILFRCNGERRPPGAEPSPAARCSPCHPEQLRGSRSGTGWGGLSLALGLGTKGDVGTLTDLVQAVVELVPQGPEDVAHLVAAAVAQRVPVHVAAGEVDDAGVVLVLLHVVADPLQHLHLGPEVRELTEPLWRFCKGRRAGLRVWDYGAGAVGFG